MNFNIGDKVRFNRDFQGANNRYISNDEFITIHKFNYDQIYTICKNNIFIQLDGHDNYLYYERLILVSETEITKKKEDIWYDPIEDIIDYIRNKQYSYLQKG